MTQPGFNMPFYLSFTVLTHQFHTKCGRNIKLTDDCTVASRVDSYNCGIVFSNGSLKNGEMFEVLVYCACVYCVCVYMCVFARLLCIACGNIACMKMLKNGEWAYLNQ